VDRRLVEDFWLRELGSNAWAKINSANTKRERESSLQVTNTTYSGLQEHRIIVYTATTCCYRAESKAKGTFEHGNHSYRKFKQNTRSMQKGNRGTQVENSSIPYCAVK
jgi:hypothetical protein